MEYKRWLELEQNIDGTLTEKELADGWHWCCEFDYLLVGPDMSEIEYCLCEGVAIKTAKQAYCEHTVKEVDCVVGVLYPPAP